MNDMANSTIQIISIIGFLLSAYSLYVEIKSSKSKSYKAVCDINEKVSCTKVFSSQYGKILGLSNSFYGILLYILIFILNIYEYANLIFYLAILSVLGSVYLAYVMYFKIKSYCLVCNAIYAVNILLLVFSYF